MNVIDGQIDGALETLAGSINGQPTKQQIMAAMLRGQQSPSASFSMMSGQQQPPPMQPMQPQPQQPPYNPQQPLRRAMAQAQQQQQQRPPQMPQQQPQAMPQQPPPQVQQMPQQMPAQAAQQPQQVPTLPQEWARLEKDREVAQQRLEAAAAPVDRRASDENYQRHLEKGDQALLRALAANAAGPQFADMTRRFLAEYGESRQNIKTEDGVFTPGGFLEDASRATQNAIKVAEARIAGIDRAMQNVLSREEQKRLQDDRQAETEKILKLTQGFQGAQNAANRAQQASQNAQASEDRRLDREQRADAAATAGGKGKPVNPEYVLGRLATAKALLAKATGSGAGALVDQAAHFFGQETEGSQATASLKTIAGELTGLVPRFEGPQSDADVKLYKEMAGDLANDALPRGVRLAALETMVQMHRDNASGVTPPRNLPPPPRTPQAPAAAASPSGRSGPVRVRSAAEARALPPGTEFITPDGQTRTRQ